MKMFCCDSEGGCKTKNNLPNELVMETCIANNSVLKSQFEQVLKSIKNRGIILKSRIKFESKSGYKFIIYLNKNGQVTMLHYEAENEQLNEESINKIIKIVEKSFS